MLVMGLDTALQRCSVAIARDGIVQAHESEDMARGHAERLAPMASVALETAGVKARDLYRVGVVVGPGGFTGVRVALSFARGLGVGTRTEIVGVTSLAALAAGAEGEAQERLIAPVIDARRGQVYAALYGAKGDVVTRPFVAEPKAALRQIIDEAKGREFILTGSGAPLLDPAAAGDAQIDAKIVAQLAAAAPAPDGPPAPLYLRAPDAKPGRPSVFQLAPGA